MEESTVASMTSDEPITSEAQVSEAESEETGRSEKEDGSKKNREISRLARVIQNLQAENKRLKGDLSSSDDESDEGEYSDEETLRFSKEEIMEMHPALKGLEMNEEGDVLFQGEFVSPEFVISQYENDQTNDGSAGEDAYLEAQIEALGDDLFSTVGSTISELREESFPGLDKEHSALLDEYMLSQADVLLTRAFVEGNELSPDLVDQVGREALSKARQLFSVFGELQVKDNQEYAQTYRVKPDGRPGTRAPIDESKLTKTEQLKLSRERTRMAEAMRKET